jgi:hypothetical protein
VIAALGVSNYVARTPNEAGNFRVRSAEGFYNAKARPRFDSESPTRTGLFAYIYTYLRTFALKTFFFPVITHPQ